jgi:Lipocalin-like domain
MGIRLHCGFLLVVACGTAIADQHETCSGPQVGTWKLQSFRTEDVQSGRVTEPYGAHPTGYLSYGADCRMYAIIVKEGRRVPAGPVVTDVEKVDLFGSLLSYAGTYTVEGDKISHHVDVSWNQAWTGTTQVRHFSFKGTSSLEIRTTPARNPRDGRLTSGVLVWTKVN